MGAWSVKREEGVKTAGLGVDRDFACWFNAEKVSVLPFSSMLCYFEESGASGRSKLQAAFMKIILISLSALMVSCR